LPGSTYGGDYGGTRFRQAASRPGEDEVYDRGDIRRYDGLVALLQDCFGKLGFVPEVAVIAVAGNWRDGMWDFTNLPWDPVTEQEVLKATGVRRLLFINDMQAAQRGAVHVRRDDLVLLKPGRVQPGRSICAFTSSTGVNHNSGVPGESLPMPRESGHIRPAVPIDFSDVTRLVRFASRQYDATVEDLIGGQRGPGMIADYVTREIMTPSERVRSDIDARRAAGKDLAPLMTNGVMTGDPFWLRVGVLYADLLGYVLNTVIVGDLVGELVLQGSVIMGTPGFAQWMFDPESTSLSRNLVSAGLPKSYVAVDCAVWGAPEEASMAALGSERIARSMLQRPE
jgi:glucokinase